MFHSTFLQNYFFQTIFSRDTCFSEHNTKIGDLNMQFCTEQITSYVHPADHFSSNAFLNTKFNIVAVLSLKFYTKRDKMYF